MEFRISNFGKFLYTFVLATCVLTLLSYPTVAADQPAASSGPPKLVLVPGDRLAIVGDSITEQRIYSRMMEDYLTACTPGLNLWIIQLGWNGETAAGFLQRMDGDLLSLNPTVITTCYGMNDGAYSAYMPKTGRNYNASMTALVRRAKKAGIRVVVVGSPGTVDRDNYPAPNSFSRRPGFTSTVYNDTLAKLTEIDRRIAHREGQVFADLHDTMMQVMTAAKAANGSGYAVCGPDGVHPGPDGHLIMAYTFLKAMGLDGQIGVITLDMAGSAQATEGHKVLQFANGKAEIESTRYPFCFLPDPRYRDASEASILPFLPFNHDLNRFMLVIKGLKADKAKVTWGGGAKTFTRQQLEAGINLAAEFPNDNPFVAPFRKLDALVAKKQEFETQMIKTLYHSLGVFRSELADDADAQGLVTSLYARLNDKQDALREQVKAAVTPVRYTITVEAE